MAMSPGPARRSKRDLRVKAMPVPSVEEWRDPEKTLEVLRGWMEDQATDVIDWYLRDKAWKRIGSRLLRAAAILLAVAGGVAPLLATTTGRPANWGYIMLALAAGCVAFDHFFGLSSGWMRDIATARAVQRRLETFRFAWAAANAARAFHADAATVQSGLDLIQQFAIDVADSVDAETAEWLTEFRANITNFVTHDPQSKP
jgi:conflict system pore-forming effector with SLATT domain